MRGKEFGSNLALCAFSLIREHRFRFVIISRNHKVATAGEMGWSTAFETIELLDAAQREFDLLVTTDQALRTETKSVEAQDCDSSFARCKLSRG